MKKIKLKNIFKIFILGFVIFGLVFVQRDVRNPDHVRAFGHLVVDLGVPSGDPIFEISNMLPGDCFVREVNIDNGGDSPTNLSVRSDNEIDNDNLSQVIDFTVSNGGVHFDGTLKEFFEASNGLDGVSLGNLNDGDDEDYEFEACFREGAGNEYQSTEVVFDLIFGEIITPFELPEECSILEGSILFVIEGTEGDDELDGTLFGDLIIAKGGVDDVDGDGGDDCIVGGDGADDELDGGVGNDIILGGAGNDEIEGGASDDIIYGGEGDDVIDGESGNDLVFGGPGEDEISLGSGEDEAHGGADNDFIEGNGGNDEIFGDGGDDELDGGPGDDSLDGGPGFDVLDGSPGTDTCTTGEDLDSCEL